MNTLCRMGSWLAPGLALWLGLSPQALRALPQQVGTGQVFADGRDFTGDFIAAANWDGDSLPGRWRVISETGDVSLARMEAVPVLFGREPIEVTASYRGGRLESISVLYLEAGAYFGYQSRLKETSEGRAELRRQQREFEKRYGEISAAVGESLREVFDQPGQFTTSGRTTALREALTVFEQEPLRVEYRALENQFVRVDLRRAEDAFEGYLDPRFAKMDRRERRAWAEANVRREPDGDVLISGVPLVPQGRDAYCGIHSFAMISRYFGLRLDASSLAAGAGFRQGIGGDRILEVYQAAAKEAGLRMSRAGKFDFERAVKGLDEGYPVLVWRRFDSERDRLHTGFARRYAANPRLTLPIADGKERGTWPGDGHPSHSSVITGYNRKRGEVIFTEPWGEHTRDRRMRIEEMESSSYGVFYFKI
ncbi:MAG TPA: C39 family peptidase [Verrucomicrobiales bacterium]|nr:C39 family peptidase [Verrucomicrobiales bacterium]